MAVGGVTAHRPPRIDELQGKHSMHDFIIALAFVGMLLAPVVAATTGDLNQSDFDDSPPVSSSRKGTGDSR
jgi:hypothetical protein